MFGVLVGVFVCFFYVFKYLLQNKNKGLPPGPPRFPLIGSLPHLFWAGAKTPPEALRKLGLKYGPIYTVELGSVLSFVINGYELMTNIGFSEDLLSHSDETDVFFVEKSKSVSLGLLFALPQFWGQTRLACQRILKKYGFAAKSKMEQNIMEEFMEFCDDLKTEFDETGTLRIKLTNQFTHLFFNIATTQITGKKYVRSDSRTEVLLKAMDDFAKIVGFGSHIVHLYPKLAHIFPKLMGYDTLKTACDSWRQITCDFIREERDQMKTLEEPDNFLAEFLQRIESPVKKSSTDEFIYTPENLTATLQDLHLGGAETQAHIVKFLIRFLVSHPDVQERLQREVDEVIGKNRLVTCDDIPKLSYVQATLNEVYRLGCAVVATPRKLINDAVIAGYKLPKGATVILSIWGAHRDSTVWENPLEFNPDRFLSEDGTTLVNTEKIVAFGFGKRRCIGEQLARTSLILGVTTLVQQFSFHLDPVTGVPSEDDIFRFTRDTPPFYILIRKR